MRRDRIVVMVHVGPRASRCLLRVLVYLTTTEPAHIIRVTAVSGLLEPTGRLDGMSIIEMPIALFRLVLNMDDSKGETNKGEQGLTTHKL